MKLVLSVKFLNKLQLGALVIYNVLPETKASNNDILNLSNKKFIYIEIKKVLSYNIFDGNGSKVSSIIKNA